MASIIRIKRSTGTAAPGTLKTGELAYSAGTGTSANFGDRLFFGKGDDGSGNATTVEVIGGAYFANLADHTPGTLTANSAIITDGSSKIDQLIVDNVDINGNTISTTSGDLILNPTSDIDVNNNQIKNLAAPTLSTDAATKAYVDAVSGATYFTVNGDTGSDTVNLADSAVTITGGTGLSSAVTNNTVTINLDNTSVSPGSYGSATAIPTFTVDQQGRLTAASTVSVATTLNLAGETGTGSVSILDSDLTIAAGEGINTVASGTTITISGEDATTSNKGIASFEDSDFIVTAGHVRIKEGGVSNAQLANSTITLGSSTLTLGAATTDVDGLTSLIVDDIKIDGSVISNLSASNSLYIDPAPVGDSAGGFAGQLVIRGDLVVQGSTTTVNSTTVSINDLNLVLADSAANAAAADGAGITIGGAGYSGTKATILYDGATDRWDLNKGLEFADSIGGTNTVYFSGTKLSHATLDLIATSLFEGEGIDLSYNVGSRTFTIAAEDASVTNKGVANFDSDQFTVTGGLVTVSVLDGGTY